MPVLLAAVLVAFLINSSLGHPLFKRQGGAGYPDPGTVGPQPLPAWIARYEQAKAAGRLVDAPASPYPAGVDAGASGICSWTMTQCFAPDDLHSGPDGSFGVSFDDGPSINSPSLYSFLESVNQSATHFMIGGNILSNPDIFRQSIASGGHAASHSWSHPQMTSLTDMQILGELGWTSQIIFDLSGLVPGFWRPPYGDIDNRVRAIAREVFGLQHCIWNQDTDDWCLNAEGGSSCGSEGPTTDEELDSELLGFISGPKSPGLMVLQHELTTRSIAAFTRVYSQIMAQGWKVMTIADLWSDSWYRNAPTNAGPVDESISIAVGTTNSASAAGLDDSPIVEAVASVVEDPAKLRPSASRTTTVLVTVTLPRPTASS